GVPRGGRPGRVHQGWLGVAGGVAEQVVDGGGDDVGGRVAVVERGERHQQRRLLGHAGAAPDVPTLVDVVLDHHLGGHPARPGVVSLHIPAEHAPGGGLILERQRVAAHAPGEAREVVCRPPVVGTPLAPAGVHRDALAASWGALEGRLVDVVVTLDVGHHRHAVRVLDRHAALGADPLGLGLHVPPGGGHVETKIVVGSGGG